MTFFHTRKMEAAIYGNFKAALFPKLTVNGDHSFLQISIHDHCVIKTKLGHFEEQLCTITST